MLDHGEAKVVIVDPEFAGVMKKALALRKRAAAAAGDRRRRRAVHGPGRAHRQHRLRRLSRRAATPAFAWQLPADEWDAIALNYTSGTTGNPKGVVYHHRGAAINAISNILEWDMRKHPVYLWTLPMFHCNGWCFPVDGGRARRRQRVPAQGGGQGHHRRDQGARRHALLRRAHRARHAGQRARRDEAGPADAASRRWWPAPRRRPR